MFTVDTTDFREKNVICETNSIFGDGYHGNRLISQHCTHPRQLKLVFSETRHPKLQFDV